MKDSFLQFLALSKRAGKLIEGYNRCEEKIMHNIGFLCIISKDISKNSYEKFERLCKNHNIAIIYDYSKEELGNILGREEINIVCITDKSMSKRLIELYENNQNNRG